MSILIPFISISITAVLLLILWFVLSEINALHLETVRLVRDANIKIDKQRQEVELLKYRLKQLSNPYREEL